MPKRTIRLLAAMCVVAGVLVGVTRARAAGPQHVFNTGLFTVGPNEIAYCYLTIDDLPRAPSARVVLEFLDENSAVLAHREVTVQSGHTGALRTPGPDLMRCRIKVFETATTPLSPRADDGARRRGHQQLHERCAADPDARFAADTQPPVSGGVTDRRFGWSAGEAALRARWKGAVMARTIRFAMALGLCGVLVARTGRITAAAAPRADPFAACRQQFAAKPLDYESAYCFYQSALKGRVLDEGARVLEALMRGTPGQLLAAARLRSRLSRTRPDPCRGAVSPVGGWLSETGERWRRNSGAQHPAELSFPERAAAGRDRRDGARRGAGRFGGRSAAEGAGLDASGVARSGHRRRPRRRVSAAEAERTRDFSARLVSSQTHLPEFARVGRVPDGTPRRGARDLRTARSACRCGRGRPRAGRHPLQHPQRVVAEGGPAAHPGRQATPHAPRRAGAGVRSGWRSTRSSR